MDWTNFFWKSSAVLLLACLLELPGIAEPGKRQVLVHPDPLYPPILKRFNVSGLVKIQVVITPAGNVKTATVLGGDAALAQAALDAVRQWKYAPAEAESVVTVEFRFTP